MIVSQLLVHQNGAEASHEVRVRTPTLRTCALAALAAQMVDFIHADPELHEHRFLLEQLQAVGDVDGWRLALERALMLPSSTDATLVELSKTLGLEGGEVLTVALALAVEEDAMIGRVLAYLQQPMGGSRPTLGLAARTFFAATEQDTPPIYTLVNGAAVQSGLLTLLNEGAPLPERTLAIPRALTLALVGIATSWQGAIGEALPALALPQALLDEAKLRGQTLNESMVRLLVLRGAALEAQVLANEVAAGLGKRPFFLPLDVSTAGLGIFLRLRNLLPVFVCELGPGEHKVLPAIPFYQGPLVATCGVDGALEVSGEAALNWLLPVPNRQERATLWQMALDNETLVNELAQHHRHSSSRIAQLGRLARYHARLRGDPTPAAADLLAAAWNSDSGLATLAQPLPEQIPDAALVATAALRRDLDSLLLRCRSRDGLVEGLGASSKARYRPGVRALFVGASGAGKTLAVGWLATQLHLPLYRVDLAAVTSKYIGETEKNLSQLLARAEQSEVILLFDEADSLFGKRTDVQQSNDRFANAQTNYLLQRIESYEGIALLTSNSRSRFDPAFMRRLDMIIDFPTPGPQERRALWLSHLGTQHQVDGQQINRIAAACDLAGGHIRNVVLSAAVLAQSHRRPIQYDDLLAGLGDEYRKLGRQLPVEL
ncbi:MAG: ATP-binding protein [Caldilineaceae bacterium]